MHLRVSMALAIASAACSPDRTSARAPDWGRVPVSLELRLASGAPASGLVPAVVHGQGDTVYLYSEPELADSHVARVEAAKATGGRGLVLAVWLTEAGARQLSSMTGQHIGDTLAVLINSVVVSTPIIEEKMGGDPRLPNHVGVPLSAADAGLLATAVSKTWPPAPAPSAREAGKNAR